MLDASFSLREFVYMLVCLPFRDLFMFDIRDLIHHYTCHCHLASKHFLISWLHLNMSHVVLRFLVVRIYSSKLGET